MPDAVAVADFFVVNKPINADAVEQSARHQPCQPAGGQRAHQRIDGHQYQPAHHHIQQQRQLAGAPPQRQLLHDAEQAQPPHRAEQRPAPRAFERYQRKGGVAAGNQQVDGAVVELLQHRFGTGKGHAVIDGRTQIQQHQAAAVHGGAGDFVAVAARHGLHQQQHQAKNRQRGAGQVAVCVESFADIHGLSFMRVENLYCFHCTPAGSLKAGLRRKNR